MTRSQGQSTTRRFFNSRLFIVIGIFLILLLAFGYGRAYYQGYKVEQDIKKLQDDISSLERKKLESMEVLSYVMSDRFVEEKARMELNLKKPDEKMIIVADETSEVSEVVEPVNSSGQPLSNPLKWWYFFTHQELPGAAPQSSL